MVLIIPEIWRIIKDYLIDYKKHHMIKYKPIIKVFNNMFTEMYERWTGAGLPGKILMILLEMK